MSAIKCENRTVCCDQDGDNPLGNFSMELPDPNRFLAGQQYIFIPPLGASWSALGCEGWCWSDISQADAELCARNQQQSCTVDPTPNHPGTPGGGPNGNPGWTDPDGKQTELFPNQAQSCTVICPDGTPFTVNIPMGIIYELSQADANYKAHGYACKQAANQILCLVSTSPLPAGCPGVEYDQQLSATGNAFPYVWTIVGGQLPAGLSMSSSGRITGIIDPSQLGDFVITVQVVDALGNTRQKNLLIGVCGAVNSSTLAAYQIGVPYSVFITGVQSAGCGVGTQTFQLIGILPNGLQLDPVSGEIFGTPVSPASGNYTFEIRVTTQS